MGGVIEVNTSKIVLIIIGTLTVVFTIVMIVLFWTHYAIPDTLVTCWFAAVGGECGVLGWIKTNKVRYIERQWQIEDYERYKEDNKHD